MGGRRWAGRQHRSPMRKPNLGGLRMASWAERWRRRRDRTTCPSCHGATCGIRSTTCRKTNPSAMLAGGLRFPGNVPRSPSSGMGCRSPSGSMRRACILQVRRGYRVFVGVFVGVYGTVDLRPLHLARASEPAASRRLGELLLQPVDVAQVLSARTAEGQSLPRQISPQWRYAYTMRVM